MNNLIEKFRAYIVDIKDEFHVSEDIFNIIFDEYISLDYFRAEITEMSNKPESIILHELGNGFYAYFPAMLFNKAIEKLGIPLWNSKAWLDNECPKRCPIGDWCNRNQNKIYSIYDGKYCIGQLLLSRNYKTHCSLKLPQLTYEDLCDIIHQPYEYSDIIKAENVAFDFGRTMKKSERMIWGYVSEYPRKSNRFIGGNIIPFL